MSESLKLYRAQLDAAYLKMVEEYDKAIMTLSGGGLGITFVFIKDFIGTNAVQRKQVLFWTWVCWGLSITFVILSFITSQKAVRRAIEQVNTGEIYSQAPGGRFAALTSVFNHLGALLFFAGLSLFVYFVYHNLGAK